MVWAEHFFFFKSSYEIEWDARATVSVCALQDFELEWNRSWGSGRVLACPLLGEIEIIEKARDPMLADGGSFEAVICSHSPEGWESLRSPLGTAMVEGFSSLRLVPAQEGSNQPQEH